jgi:putative endonuclease
MRHRLTSTVARGRAAERAVAAWLEARGFVIVDQNARFGALEIDLIATRGDLVVLCEVRWRNPSSYQTGLESVTPVKRRHMLEAARRFWHTRAKHWPGSPRLRLDIAVVTHDDVGRSAILYCEGAVSGDAEDALPSAT